MKIDKSNPLVIAFASEYSTTKAITVLYNLGHDWDSDEEITNETVTEILNEVQEEDPCFVIQAVNWDIVNPAVKTLLDDWTKRLSEAI